MFGAHEVGDHWLQTHGQACGKGAPGWPGRILCARHVATLTAVKAAAVAVVALVLALPVNLYAVAAALAIDAVSHYWADRRSTLLALADWLGRTVLPGKGEFARLGDGAAAPTGTGAYALDLLCTLRPAVVTPDRHPYRSSAGAVFASRYPSGSHADKGREGANPFPSALRNAPSGAAASPLGPSAVQQVV